MKSKLILIYYFILLVIEISAEILFSYTDNANLMFVTKPLLMPTLIVWAFLFAKEHSLNLNKSLVAALIFSLFGDVSLMFISFKPQIFILGLICFLVAHILYISLFLNSPFKSKASLIKQNPSILLACTGYGVALIWFLYKQNQPEFLKMQFPVIIYASVILLMLLAALSIYQKHRRGTVLIIIGAVLFVLSDSTIALSKFSLLFKEQQNLARIIIMSLYGIAQFMIVKGYLLSTINHQITSQNKISEEHT